MVIISYRTYSLLILNKCGQTVAENLDFLSMHSIIRIAAIYLYHRTVKQLKSRPVPCCGRIKVIPLLYGVEICFCTLFHSVGTRVQYVVEYFVEPKFLLCQQKCLAVTIESKFLVIGNSYLPLFRLVHLPLDILSVDTHFDFFDFL